MISLGLGRVIGGGVVAASFDADYQAILTNAISRGAALPNASEQVIQNQLIVDLKSAGIWSKLDGFYMFANNITDSTGAYARINWKNPSANYATAFVNLPSITNKSGFTGDGNNQGLNLNLAANAGANFKNPNGSFGVFVGTISTNNSPIMGAGSAINRIRNQSPTASTNLIARSTITTNYSSNSVIHLNVNGTVMTAYKNGVGTNGTYASWGADDTSNWAVLRYGDLASYGTSQIKMAFIGGNLASEAATFSTTIQNYITAVNAL
jgi:hypothetical protein